jgi:hypothetical protein
MSLFDHLRPKWKHSDPIVREQAVLELDDQDALEKIAYEDPCESVRLAAVQKLTDQHTLSRFARRNDSLAVAALKQLTDHAFIASVAQFSESREVRELAVDKIDDPVILHRIASSDTDARVRWKAKRKSIGSDGTREVIRNELAKLQLARQMLENVSEFCGTLDDVCSALIADHRFRINAAIDRNDPPGLATIRELDTKSEVPVPSVPAAQFLASKRIETEGIDEAAANAFFEIKVWRTDENTFHCHTEEKRLDMVQNSVVWSRVSNGATGGSTAKNNSVATATTGSNASRN